MFSLLHCTYSEKEHISQALLENLDISFLGTNKEYPLIYQFFTCDAESIKTRQQLFAFLTQDASLVRFFETLEENIKNISECRKNSVGNTVTNESLYYSFREFFFFSESIEGICQIECDSPSSPIYPLYQKAKEIQGETWYQNAKLFTEKLDDNLKNIKSVTIGINLNAKLQPMEAGIVAVESSPYVTNTIFDKMFAPKIENKNMICIAPIGMKEAQLSDAQGAALNINLYRALNEIMATSLKKIKNILTRQFLHAADFLLEIEDEVHFINMGMQYILQMQAKGLSICNPDISDTYEISDLYNPNLARYTEIGKIVKNDVVFDDCRIHLIVGVNSGGKTVYMRSVGLAQILFQLGLPIPAKSAKMFMVDRIASCFSAKMKDTVGGRLENECHAISNICDTVSENSLILLDELFSSTNSYDAVLLAKKLTEWFASHGCCVLYTTHIHDLISQIDEINALPKLKSKIDTLVADFSGENPTYQILRKPYKFESNAMKIFEKYGMGFLQE